MPRIPVASCWSRRTSLDRVPETRARDADHTARGTLKHDIRSLRIHNKQQPRAWAVLHTDNLVLRTASARQIVLVVVVVDEAIVENGSLVEVFPLV